MASYTPSRGQFKGVEFAGRSAYRTALNLAKVAAPTPSGKSRVYVPTKGAHYGHPFASYHAYRNAIAKEYGFTGQYERRKLTSLTGAQELTAKAKRAGVRPTKRLYMRLKRGQDAGYTVTSDWLDALVTHEEEGNNPLWYH